MAHRAFASRQSAQRDALRSSVRFERADHVLSVDLGRLDLRDCLACTSLVVQLDASDGGSSGIAGEGFVSLVLLQRRP